MPLRRLLSVTGFYRLVWHRPLFDLALYVLLFGGVVVLTLWNDFMNAPWTRDGRVRADAVAVAPDVSGLFTEVRVEGRNAMADQAAADYARYSKLNDAAVS